MVKFSEHFALEKTQGELDFVDVELSTDNELYLCPYAIQIRNDNWSEACGDHIRSFFNEVLDQLRRENLQRVQHLLGHLHEPNETFLGVSTGEPSGRGMGPEKAEAVAQALLNSRAFETGILADVSEAELFIRGIIARCRDTANDGRGYMVVLEDQDITQMLGWVRDGNRREIDRHLTRRLDEISN